MRIKGKLKAKSRPNDKKIIPSFTLKAISR